MESKNTYVIISIPSEMYALGSGSGDAMRGLVALNQQIRAPGTMRADLEMWGNFHEWRNGRSFWRQEFFAGL